MFHQPKESQTGILASFGLRPKTYHAMSWQSNQLSQFLLALKASSSWRLEVLLSCYKGYSPFSPSSDIIRHHQSWPDILGASGATGFEDHPTSTTCEHQVQSGQILKGFPVAPLRCQQQAEWAPLHLFIPTFHSHHDDNWMFFCLFSYPKQLYRLDKACWVRTLQ